MFTVTWTQSASDQLAAAWMKADSSMRDEITKYVQQLDGHLRANADRISELREPVAQQADAARPACSLELQRSN